MDNVARARLMETLKRSIDEVEMSLYTYNRLKKSNIRTVGDLVQYQEAELMRRRGRFFVKELKDILGSMGLCLGMELDEKIRAAIVQSDQSSG